MKMIKYILLQKTFLPLALLFIVFSCFGQPEQAQRRIDSVMQQYDMPGLSVAVVKKGAIIYAHSFGVKNKETGAALTNDDIFRIASISKSFSATSIMQLVQAKKLSLDDDVSNLIGFTVRNPKFPDKVITVRMILSHTSGINDSQGYFTLDAINPAKNPDAAKCYNDYVPGQGYQYCNLNFTLAGTIVERVSGQRFDKYVKEHIIDPLGLYGGFNVGALDSTRFVTLYEYDSATSKLTADPEAYNPRTEQINNYVMGYSTPVFSPAGGMKLSATDLAKYMTMHMYKGRYKGTRIISRKSAVTMQTPVSHDYGLALMTTGKLIPGVTMRGHTGSAYGLFSMMFFQPHKKFGFVAITNGCNLISYRGFNPALKAVINILYEEMIR
jgi:CubicO group peptidase (beta-lactamase class C family)